MISDQCGKYKRGDRAADVCVIGDGALWIWNIAEEQFHGACKIVDLYHAHEHYWSVNGANNIIALRCSQLSNRWEDFWE